MKNLKFLFAIAFTLLIYSCNQPGTTTDQVSAPSQSALMKTAYQEIVKAFDTGNTDSLGKYVAENVIDHGDAEAMGITSTGLQRLKDMIAVHKAAFPEMKMDFHHVVADGNMLMAHGTMKGTNSGEFMGQPATNKTVNSEFVDIIRYENGKFVEHWEVSDKIAFMTQMGFMPPMDSVPAAIHHPDYDWNATAASDSAKVAKMKESYNAVLNMIESGDLTNLDQHLAADFKENLQIPGITLADGIEGARQAMTLFKQYYPDLNMTVEHIAAEGDILMAHIWVEGTLAPGMPGLPPTAAGKKVKFATVDIVEFKGDKATAHWEVSDHYTELMQLGVIPDPGAKGQPAAN